MKLIILRHGEAGRATTDFDRNLTHNGRSEVAAISQASLASLKGANAFVSPYVRAQQTLHEVSQHVVLNRQTTLPIITPDDSPEAVLEWLTSQPESDFPMLLVSHQPMVSRLISLLVDGDFLGYYPMSTASMTVLESDVWAKGLASVVSQTHVADLQ